MLKDKRILYLGTTPWSDATEQQFIFEKLASANLAIWINPFGKINESLLPKITRLNSELTVYYPGMNFFGLPFLAGINERRRLLQIKLYLIERDFEPDLVWFDDPLAGLSAQYYKDKGARVIYFACPAKNIPLDSIIIKRLSDQSDFIFTTDQQIFKKFSSNSKAYLLSGEQYLSKEEKNALAGEVEGEITESAGDGGSPADEIMENAFLKLVAYNCEQIEHILLER